MKPDTDGPRLLIDHDERAHLRLPEDRSHRIWRYAPSTDLADLVGRYWIPVWSLSDGAESVQRVLQYPVALIVIDGAEARFSGVTSGLSSVTLRGRGYAFGVMLRPAAGALIAGTPMSSWADRSGSLSAVLGDDADQLAAEVRATMVDRPDESEAHFAAIGAAERLLRRYVPIDDEGEQVNEIVSFVETTPEVARVTQVCEQFRLGERALQRLTHRRLGISPKWLIRRRRLHEATEALRSGAGSIAEIAARLGYADQAHLTRDLRSVTDLTPAQLADIYRSSSVLNRGPRTL